MGKLNGQLVLLLLLLTATWVWSMVALAGWRLRRRVRLGLPGPVTSDTLVRLTVRGHRPDDPGDHSFHGGYLLIPPSEALLGSFPPSVTPAN